MLRMIQAVHQASLWPESSRFRKALDRCESVQLTMLGRLVTRNKATIYGREYGWDGIQSQRDWQARVPIVSYDDLAPYVQRAAAGEPNVLTAEPIRIFEKSSGSTSGNKLIPYTRTLLSEFAAATGPWLFDIQRAFPELSGTTSYWSVSPVQRGRETTPGGIRIGFEDDTEYFGRLERFALNRMLAVGPEVARIQDAEAWTRATVEGLLRSDNLGFISIWHPSFWDLLLEQVGSRWEAWVSRHAPHRLAGIRLALENHSLAEALWPKLRLISCWGDGPARAPMQALAKKFPRVHIQAKGLLATEGVISIPLQAGNSTQHVAALRSHFFEFIDANQPAAVPKLAHELRPGAEYIPLLSTGGGFYRYRLGDVVRCEGFYYSAPCLSFQGRMDQVSDVCGEKLHARQVADALEQAEDHLRLRPEFALVAPVSEGETRYVLFVEGITDGEAQALANQLEMRLGESHGYGYARKLGQLAGLRAEVVVRGSEKYLRAKAAEGRRVGQVKPSVLEKQGPWRTIFELRQPDAMTAAVRT